MHQNLVDMAHFFSLTLTQGSIATLGQIYKESDSACCKPFGCAALSHFQGTGMQHIYNNMPHLCASPCAGAQTAAMCLRRGKIVYVQEGTSSRT